MASAVGYNADTRMPRLRQSQDEHVSVRGRNLGGQVCKLIEQPFGVIPVHQ